MGCLGPIRVTELNMMYCSDARERTGWVIYAGLRATLWFIARLMSVMVVIRSAQMHKYENP